MGSNQTLLVQHLSHTEDGSGMFCETARCEIGARRAPLSGRRKVLTFAPNSPGAIADYLPLTLEFVRRETDRRRLRALDQNAGSRVCSGVRRLIDDELTGRVGLGRRLGITLQNQGLWGTRASSRGASTWYNDYRCSRTSRPDS